MNNSNKAKNFCITQNKLAFFLLLMFQFNCCDFRGRKDASCVDSSTIIQNLSFCGKYVSSTICVPYTHPLWPNWNVKEIDFEVFQFVALAVESRIENELSSSPTYPNLEFTSNYKCLEAYKSFACLVNFPPCDKATDSTKSFPL